MVIDNKGKLPLHLVGQSASQKNRAKSDDIIKLLKSKMPEDDDEGMNTLGEKGVGYIGGVGRLIPTAVLLEQ